MGFCPAHLTQTPRQNPYAKKDALESAGVERPQLWVLIDQLREGDVMVVTMYDRLARALKDLLEIVDAINAKGGLGRF